MAKVALSVTAIMVVALAVLTLMSQSATTRTARLNATVAEINRGNYYAWVQAKHWSARLAREERRLLREACEEYARTNAVLYARGNRWPPEPSNASWRLRAATTWLKQVLRVPDRALVFETVSSPSANELPVTMFDRMFDRQNPEP